MTKISNQYSLTNILTADLANSRLGINNVSPVHSLDVTGTARVSGNLTTNIASGLLKSVSNILTQAVAGTDYQSPISLTTTGSSGAATFSANTLNIPNYGSALSGTTNYVSKFTSSSTIGNSNIQDSGTLVTISGLTKFVGTSASDTAPLGSELAAVSGTGTSWTLVGTNLNVGGFSHTIGDVTPLTTTLAAVIGTYYQIVTTITNRTTGSVVISYGGFSQSTTATFTTGPVANATTALTITPTTDFNGTVVLSIKTIGTSTASSVFANSSGSSNIEFRASSLTSNTFIGLNAGSRNTVGLQNTFFGVTTGQNNTTGTNNTAVGHESLLNNTIGNSNTALGKNALRNNTTGNTNTGVGDSALSGNTTGIRNIAIGATSLSSNTVGSNNSALGFFSLQANTSGNQNTAVGSFALTNNTTGGFNTALGQGALQLNTTGLENVGLGYISLHNNTTGSFNVALGVTAGSFIANGSTANTITNNSIFIGAATKALADNQNNQIVIGHSATGLGSNTTVLGNAFTITTAIYGNLVLGSTTDSGFKLDTNGTARITGNLTTNIASGLLKSVSNILTQAIAGTDYQSPISLTTTGTSGAATFTSNTLNIPQYQAVLTNPVTGTGTTNFVTKWTSSSAIGNSSIFDNGTAIGIGTTSIRSNAGESAMQITGTNFPLFSINGSTSGIGANLGVGSVSGFIGTYTNHPFNILTNDSVRMSITPQGNVGIGASTSPTYLLEASTAGGSQRIRVGTLQNNNNNSTFEAITTANNTTASSGWMKAVAGGIVTFGTSTYVKANGDSGNFANLSSEVQTNGITLRTDGAIFLNGFTYNNTVSSSPRTLYIDSANALGGISSTRQSKINIENINNIDWIYNLNPVSFNYRKKDSNGNYTDEYYNELTYGLIAEETTLVADYLINYDEKEDGRRHISGIEYSRLITPMLKAIQELSAEVQLLKNK